MIELKLIPKLPGVYFFKDINNAILYIGKAKNLKNRITSYFSSHEDKVVELLKQAVDIEIITTNYEIEALFLEAKLIQQHQPPFNILLKSGNPYIYIFISEEKTPTISAVRVKQKKGDYFGPFLTKKDALGVITYLKKTFQLNVCNKKIETGCLQYHIDICSGSCKSDFDENFYKLRLDIARQILQNKHKDAFIMLAEKIKVSNQSLNFERSQHLAKYQEHLSITIQTLQTLKKTKFTNIQQINKIVTSNIDLLSDLKKRLHLKNIPYTIDCFDISHMQSQSIVGSCIRFLDGRPDKKNFRHFGIKSLVQQNDYAALAEIVTRRYKKIEDYPDLIIIDGGKGQLNATKNFAGPSEIISLAKREETIFSASNDLEIKLDIKKASDRLVLEIRDYAHHFAVSYHRKKQRLT